MGLAVAPCRAWGQARSEPATDATVPAADVSANAEAEVPADPPADATTEPAAEDVAAPAEPEREPEPEVAPPADDLDDDTADATDGTQDDDVDADEGEDPDDDATELDDDATDAAPPPGNTAAPLRPMQSAAWWTMFGGFALGTTAGVLAGLAERQEDRATRLASLFDSETGAQPRYADRQDEYEGYLDRGNAYAKAAIGVGVVAGVTTIAAVALFVVDARRQRTERTTARRTLRVRTGGLEVRF